MKQKTNKMLIFTSLAAYFTYFIHGIGASILGQYKPEFAAAWGAKPLADGTLDVSMVVSVIAALGLGRLISLPFSGPLSDKYGRKLSGIIGVLCYVAYFFGMANSTSMAMGYAFTLCHLLYNPFKAFLCLFFYTSQIIIQPSTCKQIQIYTSTIFFVTVKIRSFFFNP